MSPTCEVEVMGSRARLPVTAIIDTGFDGDICIPTPLAVQLGLELTAETQVELADGTIKTQLVFAGSVHFLGKTREVAIYISDSYDSLVGTAMLADCRLTIDFPTGKVRLVRKPPRREKGSSAS
jgi:clan AA aspartic protease